MEFSASAIMLRRVDYGESDLIITLFTQDRGKVSVIAKSAKKSVKRFAGVLELFSELDVVCKRGRGKGLYILQEASLKEPFSEIRTDIMKTAYASYWAELVHEWIEEGQNQTWLYHLLLQVLGKLDTGCMPPEALSILFQMRFITEAGFSPNLTHCGICKIGMERMEHNGVLFDLGRGDILCGKCARERARISRRIFLSKGTVKQLLWCRANDLNKAARLRFTSGSVKEGLEFMEAFVPYHIGKRLRSLSFLRRIRI